MCCVIYLNILVSTFKETLWGNGKQFKPLFPDLQSFWLKDKWPLVRTSSPVWADYSCPSHAHATSQQCTCSPWHKGRTHYPVFITINPTGALMAPHCIPKSTKRTLISAARTGKAAEGLEAPNKPSPSRPQQQRLEGNRSLSWKIPELQAGGSTSLDSE